MPMLEKPQKISVSKARTSCVRQRREDASTAKTGVKWVNIHAQLRERIRSGEFHKGQKFLTIAELSSQFAVSAIISRRVLSELARENLIVQSPRVGSTIARDTRQSRIFFVLPEGTDMVALSLHSLVSSRIIGGVMRAAIRHCVDI